MFLLQELWRLEDLEQKVLELDLLERDGLKQDLLGQVGPGWEGLEW